MDRIKEKRLVMKLKKYRSKESRDTEKMTIMKKL